MNNSIANFEKFCKELKPEQTKMVDDYLNGYCAPGQAELYRNYFFRLYWLASRSKSKKIVELGCIPGGSTIPLIWTVNANDGHLWSCDISDCPEKLPFSAANLDLTRRTRVNRTKAEDMGKSWNNGPVDLIYLDTGHDYPDTCREIAAWLPHLKEGGLFVFHDTEIYKSTVLKAILEAMIQSSRLFEMHLFPDCHGHGVFQWYSGSQTSTHAMPPVGDTVVSLSHLLLSAK